MNTYTVYLEGRGLSLRNKYDDNLKDTDVYCLFADIMNSFLLTFTKLGARPQEGQEIVVVRE